MNVSQPDAALFDVASAKATAKVRRGRWSLSTSTTGWYALHQQGLGRLDGRDVRTDVACRPADWLGTYPRSTLPGGNVWGQHRCHQLGA